MPRPSAALAASPTAATPPGVTLDVMSAADNRVLAPGRLGADSSLTFKRPGEDFYILFDVGPGYQVEVEPSEIRGL